MRITIALGGNALLKAGQKGTLQEQLENIRVACRQIAQLAREHDLVITHGNGPQVGKILQQNEIGVELTPAMPLYVCGAMSQGQIGYLLQQELGAELARQGNPRDVVTVLTRVMVDPGDPSFQNPTKPIGSFYSKEEAYTSMQEKNETWVEDSGRGWRKVVPSPMPRKILEEKAIKRLIESSSMVIAAGGGGIPVVPLEGGGYNGIEAVIDKDLAGELLAEIVDAEVLVILTDVSQVYLNYGKPDQHSLGDITAEELDQHYQGGHFAAGSMGPKVQAALRFARKEGKMAIITSIDGAVDAIQGQGGTRIASKGRLTSPVKKRS